MHISCPTTHVTELRRCDGARCDLLQFEPLVIVPRRYAPIMQQPLVLESILTRGQTGRHWGWWRSYEVDDMACIHNPYYYCIDSVNFDVFLESTVLRQKYPATAGGKGLADKTLFHDQGLAFRI